MIRAQLQDSSEFFYKLKSLNNQVCIILSQSMYTEFQFLGDHLALSTHCNIIIDTPLATKLASKMIRAQLQDSLESFYELKNLNEQVCINLSQSIYTEFQFLEDHLASSTHCNITVETTLAAKLACKMIRAQLQDSSESFYELKIFECIGLYQFEPVIVH